MPIPSGFGQGPLKIEFNYKTYQQIYFDTKHMFEITFIRNNKIISVIESHNQSSIKDWLNKGYD